MFFYLVSPFLKPNVLREIFHVKVFKSALPPLSTTETCKYYISRFKRHQIRLKMHPQLQG